MSVCQEKRGQKMRSACHPCKNVPPHHKSKTGVCLQKREVSFGACTLFWARAAHLFLRAFTLLPWLNTWNMSVPPYCPVPQAWQWLERSCCRNRPCEPALSQVVGLGKDWHYHLYINKKSVVFKKKKIFNTLWTYSGKMLAFPPTTEVYSDQLKNSNNL